MGTHYGCAGEACTTPTEFQLSSTIHRSWRLSHPCRPGRSLLPSVTNKCAVWGTNNERTISVMPTTIGTPAPTTYLVRDAAVARRTWQRASIVGTRPFHAGVKPIQRSTWMLCAPSCCIGSVPSSQRGKIVQGAHSTALEACSLI